MTATQSYYGNALARIHHEGFTYQTEQGSPAIVALLAPLLERDGLVLELGCGSGLLTRHLVDAGHRVIAGDASPAMLDIARADLGDTADIRSLTLPDDPLPECDAIVCIGQVLSYLPDETAIDRCLVAIAEALRPGGILAIDVFSRELAELRLRVRDSKVTDDWAIISVLDCPAPNRFVNEHTSFIRADDGTWRREDERHVNVLVDTDHAARILTDHGIEVTVGSSFGPSKVKTPRGIATLTGHRPA